MNVVPFPQPQPPLKMWCSSCGVERTLPHAAADGPCRCGGTGRQSWPLHTTFGNPSFTFQVTQGGAP